MVGEFSGSEVKMIETVIGADPQTVVIQAETVDQVAGDSLWICFVVQVVGALSTKRVVPVQPTTPRANPYKPLRSLPLGM